MTVDATNAQELAQIAGEIGADVLQGVLRYPSETGSWQLGDTDLGEYLDRYRNQRLVLIVAPVGAAKAETYTCGVCGFVMNEAGECPRCKLAIEAAVKALEDGDEAGDAFDQVEALLADSDNAVPPAKTG